MFVEEAKTKSSVLTGLKEFKAKNPIKIMTPMITLTEITFTSDIFEGFLRFLFNSKNQYFRYKYNN